MNTETTTTLRHDPEGAPAWIARDTHEGRWQITKRGATVGWLPAAELGEAMGGVGATFVIWEYVSRLANGAQLFHRSRFVVATDGALHGYTQTGAKIVVHPADRIVRYLGRA